MANTATGIILLGVDDQSKAIVGLPLDKLDAVETWLRGICNDLIEPPLDCVIRKLSVVGDDGREKAIIRVDVPGAYLSIGAQAATSVASAVQNGR